jgi:hypothetical protein
MNSLQSSGALVVVLCYLDVPDLCCLAACCHDLKNDISPFMPTADAYALATRDGDTVEYPYTRRGGVKTFSPIFLSTFKENYPLVSNIFSTLKCEKYSRRWLHLPCRRVTHGLCIPVSATWTDSAAWHLHQFSSRSENQLKWIHVKGCPVDATVLTRLLSSCRAHLYHLLVSCVPSGVDYLRAVVDSDTRKLRRITFHRVQWSSPSRFPCGVTNVKLVKVVLVSRVGLQLLLHTPPTLQTLFLHNVTLQDNQLDVVEEFVSNCQHPGILRHLNLCSMSMTPTSCSLLGSRFRNLRILKIQNSNVTAEMLQLLLNHDNMASLTVLDLTANLLPSVALATLGEFLSRPTCKLRRLILACNFLTSDFVVDFVGCLLNNRSLQYLDLRENFLRYIGYSVLFCFLVEARDSPLSYLDLSMNQIGLEMKSDGWLPYEVGILLVKCPQLRTLKLERNTFMAPELKLYYQRLFRENFNATVVF